MLKFKRENITLKNINSMFKISLRKILFLLILGYLFLPIKSDAAVFLGCAYRPSDNDCGWDPTDNSSLLCETSKWCMVNPYAVDPMAYSGAIGTCDTANRHCNENTCPSSLSGVNNGDPCEVAQGIGGFTGGCSSNYYDTGKWDAPAKKCVKCGGSSGRIESSLCGDQTNVYVGMLGCSAGGDGKCESACGAPAACDEQTAGGAVCDSNCNPLATASPSATPTATPTPTPMPTPGGNWIKYNNGGNYYANDTCSGGSGDMQCTSLNGNTTGCPTGWSNCGTGGPSVCFVGFGVDCSDPTLRCATQYLACDCECVAPTPTPMPSSSATPLPSGLTLQGCGAGCGATCSANFSQPVSCSLSNATVSSICGAEPTCLMMFSDSSNCSCATLLAASPSASASGTPLPSGTGGGGGCPPVCGPLTNTPTFENYGFSNTFDMLVQNVTGWVLGIIGSLALLFLIIGGIMYITAGADRDRAETAKKIITAVVIGLIIALLSYSIVSEIKKILGY